MRKFLLSALLMGLLGGCVTAGYGYHDGYYDDDDYGQPGIEYRHDDHGYGYSPYSGYGYSPYSGYYGYYPYSGYGYGYVPYGYYPYGDRYRYYYGYPYYRGYPHYGYPYYGNPTPNYYYRPHHRQRRPPVTHYPTPNPGTVGSSRPPRVVVPGTVGSSRPPRVVVPGTVEGSGPPRVVVPVERSQPTVPETPRAEPRRNDGSRTEQPIRRAAPQRRSADSGDRNER